MNKTHGKVVFFEKDEDLFFCYEEQNGISFEYKFTRRIPLEKLNIQEKGVKAVDVFVKRILARYFRQHKIISEVNKNFRKPFVKERK